MFARCINSIKALFIIPTDAHNYKNTRMLKQLPHACTQADMPP